MVARLSIEKGGDAETFSTNITSRLQMETLSAFAAQPLEDHDSDIQHNNQDDGFGRSRTVEV